MSPMDPQEQPRPQPPPTAPESALEAMLKASAQRTSEALARPADGPGGMESFSIPTHEAHEAPADAPAAAAHSRRLRQNPAGAIERRLRRLGYSPAKARDVADTRDPANEAFEVKSIPDPKIPVLERIIGRNMLMEVKYLEAGQLAARAVGLIHIKTAFGRDDGMGSGFLVSPRLVLTNNHVLSSAGAAAKSTIEFNYQHDLKGTVGPTVVFEFDPDTFFVTSPFGELDFTLVAVREPATSGGGKLADFGFHPLTAVEDEVLAGECVTIIQHPMGQLKQVALRKNEVLKFPDDKDDFLHYQTDTNPGSSGSPVFNDGWEVVALHHAGKPATNAEGKTLTVDGGLWDSSMPLDKIQWVANEGIRVKAIVRYANDPARNLTPAQRQLFQATQGARVFPAPPPAPLHVTMEPPPVPAAPRPDESQPAAPLIGLSPTVPLKTDASVSNVVGSSVTSDGSVVVTVPIHLTIRLGTPTPVSGGPAFFDPGVGRGRPAISAPDAVPSGEEAVSIDQDYGDREGYDPEFLGAGELAIPLPKMTPAMTANAALNRQAHTGAAAFELPYHHYSVVLNKKRRLAFFTAVNIDGRTAASPKREADKWYYDPRLIKEEQVGNEFYKGTLFDRGHLVRRLDPAWGRNDSVIKTANDDTFHFANCSPQHKKFNEGKNLWAGLEDYLMERATGTRRRMTVFTGPVFTKDDRVLRGVPIPAKFWKVAVTTKDDGRIKALAFLVSQEDLIRPIFEGPSPAEVTREQVARTFQVRVRKIEELTGLDFGRLKDDDTTLTLEKFEATDQGEQELESSDQIIL